MGQFIYILEHPSNPWAVRIVNSDEDAEDLPKYLLYLPRLRRPLTVFKQYLVSDADAAQRLIYDKLREHQAKDDPTMFATGPDQAAALLDTLLLPLAPSTTDFQREDELLAAATGIAIKTGKIWWPSALAGPLSISFEQAQQLILGLQARGVIDAEGGLRPDFLALHTKQMAQEQRRQEAAAKAAAEKGKARTKMERAVNKLLEGLVDPDTGEPVDVKFVENGDDLALEIRATEQVRLEAERRLSALYGAPPDTST